MSRPLIATLVGLLGFVLYVAAALRLADLVTGFWAAQLGYFLIAGTLWVLPVRWLMLWAAHQR